MKNLSIVAALMVFAGSTALATTLNVPFFTDTSTNNVTGVSGYIGIKEASGSNQTITVVYTALNTAGVPTTNTAPITFLLGANQQIGWTPVQQLGAAEGAGSTVPNMSITGGVGATAKNTTGSAQVTSTGALYGRYLQKDLTRFTDFAHVLLPTVL